MSTELENKKFSVYTLEEIDVNGPTWVHWSHGLTMYIEKDGVVMKLNSDEIEQLVKSLPRTIGGTY